jgi:hypothetical protein
MGYVFARFAFRMGALLWALGWVVCAPSAAQGGVQGEGAEPLAGPAARRLTEARTVRVVEAGPEIQLPPPAPATGLSDVQRLYALLDRDQLGGITPTEAGLAGVHRMDFLRFDEDRSGDLSRDEFVFGVHEHLASSGSRAAPDLTAEATRILALRRVRALEARRIEQALTEPERLERLKRQTAPVDRDTAPTRPGSAPVRVIGGSPAGGPSAGGAPPGREAAGGETGAKRTTGNQPIRREVPPPPVERPIPPRSSSVRPSSTHRG